MSPDEREVFYAQLTRVGIPEAFFDRCVEAFEQVAAGEPELPNDPTGVDCWERYEGADGFTLEALCDEDD